MKEIGSEFWLDNFDNKENKLEYFNLGQDIKYLMSGTTAIDYVLHDIDDSIKIVYMPDYCCESMVRPFIDNNYQIEYYHVDLINNKLDIDLNKKCSIFFAMSYFGYSHLNMDRFIKEFANKNIIIIEDITHRLLSKNNYCKDAHYLIASLRKWFPIYTGGIAINLKNKFKASTSNYIIDNELVKIKKQAMILKKNYINNIINNKDEYLELFNKANSMIEDYQNKLMDNESLDILNRINIKKIIEIRYNNAMIIEDLLNKYNLLPLQLKKGDCPLFVPIIINNRDELRKELISKNIYCPVHWPNFNNFDNSLYDKELSLICDQRYNKDDITNYIRKVINYIERI